MGNITANATSYVTDGAPGSTERYAGPMGKLLYMTKVFGVDSSNLGGLNIEAELRALMQTSGGSQPGRFSDHSAFGDFSNGFGQAFDILGLARTSGGVPPEALTFLLAQQCPAGGFRLFYDTNPSCGSDDEADPDATGLAINALIGQPGTSNAINQAASWLVAQQDASGAFRGAGPTATLQRELDRDHRPGTARRRPDRIGGQGGGVDPVAAADERDCGSGLGRRGRDRL